MPYYEIEETSPDSYRGYPLNYEASTYGETKIEFLRELVKNRSQNIAAYQRIVYLLQKHGETVSLGTEDSSMFCIYRPI